MTEPRVNLPGSDRQPIRDAQALGPVDPGERIEITVVLRRRAELDVEAIGAVPLTRQELAARYGADPADVDNTNAAVMAAAFAACRIKPGPLRFMLISPFECDIRAHGMFSVHWVGDSEIGLVQRSFDNCRLLRNICRRRDKLRQVHFCPRDSCDPGFVGNFRLRQIVMYIGPHKMTCDANQLRDPPNLPSRTAI